MLVNEVESKRLGLLHEVVPTAPIAVLLNSKSPAFETQPRDVQTAARDSGQQSEQAGLSSPPTRFSPPGANNSSRWRRHAIPTIYDDRDFAAAGSLISYGIAFAVAYRQAGIYVGRILKGEKPADLPVVRPTKFELVINLKTAKKPGITLSPGLLAIADEVIE